MDWGTAMGVITAVLLVAYLGVIVWAYSNERRRAFDEAARLPLLDDGERK
jgi:cytochrome c oxidase cbb3-type subunit 4